jgi:hypothetical protein
LEMPELILVHARMAALQSMRKYLRVRPLFDKYIAAYSFDLLKKVKDG